MIRCARCSSTWGGYRTCHCSACHITFTGISSFDLHRRNGACLPPENAGLVEAGRGYSCFGEDRDDDRWGDDG